MRRRRREELIALGAVRISVFGSVGRGAVVDLRNLEARGWYLPLACALDMTAVRICQGNGLWGL